MPERGSAGRPAHPDRSTLSPTGRQDEFRVKLPLLRLYHRLPAPARSAAATARGLYLRRWRYGPGTEPLVAEALERDRWPAERWSAYQQERLAALLERAATRVPYYREQWTARRQAGDTASWHALENWPVLEKETLRRDPLAFVAEDCEVRRMFHEHTSGTTGKPLDLWQRQPTVQQWYALFEARCRRWNGVSLHDRWALLGGQLVTPVEQRRPPFWVWNAGLSQLYLSSYHLAPDLISHYLDALERYRIRYLMGYTSSLYALAQAVLSAGRTLKQVVAITQAEPVFDYQREAISRAFQCRVAESYGMAEIAVGASECEAGRLHLWPEAGYVEVRDGERAVPAGTAGDLVCTGLLNADMPLIRYRVGDRGTLRAGSEPCACGRLLPVLAGIEGRADDVLYTPDGRQIGRLDPVFKAQLPIYEAQVDQEALDRIRVRYVPAPGFSAADGASIVERLRERMGPVEVVLEAVDEVPRTRNGKFRAVICSLPAEQKDALRRGESAGTASAR
jgi:phenylacetate-CoA ligase